MDDYSNDDLYVKKGNKFEKIKKFSMNAKEKFDTTKEQVTRYIDENPRKAAVIAAGIGAAIAATFAAMVISRKRKHFA